MLDFLSDAPRSIEHLKIFLQLGYNSYIEAISQDYDWGRLATIINSLPAIKVVEINIISESTTIIRVSDQCRKIVMDALDPKIQKNNRVIRFSCQWGNYEEFLPLVD